MPLFGEVFFFLIFIVTLYSIYKDKIPEHSERPHNFWRKMAFETPQAPILDFCTGLLKECRA